MPANNGIGVQPVEGRWSAGRWSGDPNSATPGVWSGGSQTFVNVGSIELRLKRAQPSSLVRRDEAAT